MSTCPKPWYSEDENTEPPPPKSGREGEVKPTPKK